MKKPHRGSRTTERKDESGFIEKDCGCTGNFILNFFSFSLSNQPGFAQSFEFEKKNTKSFTVVTVPRKYGVVFVVEIFLC